MLKMNNNNNNNNNNNFKIIMVNNIWFKINNAQSLTFF